MSGTDVHVDKVDKALTDLMVALMQPDYIRGPLAITLDRRDWNYLRRDMLRHRETWSLFEDYTAAPPDDPKSFKWRGVIFISR